MVIKNYNVTLDSEIVEKVKNKLQREKLSPLINELLDKWLNKNDCGGTSVEKRGILGLK